jgi:exonuclease III
MHTIARTLLAAALFVTVAAAGTHAETIRIATWNIEHLRAQNGAGFVKRDTEDYEALARYAAELNADVIALQEVEGPDAAARVFNPDEYQFFFSHRNDVQNTGFAVRKSLTVTQNPDFEALSLGDSVRRGTDITVQVGETQIRMLSVHLKSGCFQDGLFVDRGGNISGSGNACGKLAQQVPVLEQWIDARAGEGVPFVVLGDWNRRFDSVGDVFFPEIDDAEPANADLARVTEGRQSECLNGAFPLYIDHIVFDLQASKFALPTSFTQVEYTDEDMDAFRLSDHCPIAVNLDIQTVEPSELKAQILERMGNLEREFLELRKIVQQLD